MEFNDSSVRDYKFENLNEDCEGDDPAKSTGYSNWGGGYGKSGYMLFYERRMKKNMKIVVPSVVMEKNAEAGTTITAGVVASEADTESNAKEKKRRMTRLLLGQLLRYL
jgi:hypothetical protein